MNRLFKLLAQMWSELDELVTDLPAPEKKVYVKGYGVLYQEPVTKIAAFAFQQAGLWGAALAAAQSEDPNASMMELALTAEPNSEMTPEQQALLLIAWVVLMVNLDAMQTFSASMPELLSRVEQGDDQSLFRAVLLDGVPRE